ncbi:hemin-degrading family protein [Candidatus Nitrosoglobus terrae]|uniref:Hemin-degrading family protein n=1 Tax=Candidatus Nitrosoglobus terrae TaxID=1630141 RepID=A0A1Q2SN71_9GAMM|nr:ChuX/HutX family heme-like substrate-binding protein [Candidatus Nitrosoglobus terrae]BAW80561.1 hemin-degrading family protein [Candidatus Nitrosoglobus terrae]
MLAALTQYHEGARGFLKADIPKNINETPLLAASCNKIVIRLCGLQDLIKELPQLGRVKVVTDNGCVAQENIGQCQTIKLWNHEGLIQGDRLNLKLFLNHWHYGFAVQESLDDGFYYGLQFFNRDGSSVHKIYLTADSNREAYERLVNCYRSVDQELRRSIAPVPRLPQRADKEIDVDLLRQSWLDFQDIRDLSALFKNFGITRIQGLGLVGSDLATPIALSDVWLLIEALRDIAQRVTFCVGNLGAVQTYVGVIKYLFSTRFSYTLLDVDFTLQIERMHVTSAWIVRKSIAKNTVISLELYNGAGENILQIISQGLPDQKGIY